MRLIELDPKWLLQDGKRVGFTFVSPVQRASQRPDNPTRWRQSCFSKPTSSNEQYNLLGDDPVQHCNPEIGWTIVGGIENASFESMTVTPSLDGSAGGLWHGHITNGEIK